MSSLTDREKDEGQKLNSDDLMGSLQKSNQAVHYSTTIGENVLPSQTNETFTPLQRRDKNGEREASRDSRSSLQNFYGNQTPFEKLSSPSCSKDWYLESQHKSERVGQKQFRRLRKLGDVCRKTSLECNEQTNVSSKRLAGSCFTTNQTVNKKRRGINNFSYFLFSSNSYLIVSYSIASLLCFYPVLGILYLSRLAGMINF